MSRYTVSWDLAGRRVLVVGGGRVAEAKVETLRDTGADIVVVDRTLTARLHELAESGALTWRRRHVRPWDVLRCALVIAATDRSAVNTRVARWAGRAGALVNVVDDPARCDVVVPAVVRRGPATIAITTGGATPAGARFLRETVEAALPADIGVLLDAATAARAELRSSGRYRYDYPAWRQRLFEPGLAALAAQDGSDRSSPLDAVDELRRRFVAGFDSATPVAAGGVTLVGAGPGGPDLVTVAGVRALAGADVVVHDRLADPALLDLAPVVAERIPVGKAKGHGTSQAEINRILVDRARRGHRVVRLKGGDPALFGRSGEEIDALARAGIPVTVVPGVSSALGAPSLAGIPLTHRDHASSVAIVSGHRVDASSYDWEAVARGADTIVVMMAASTGHAVGRGLLAAGLPGDRPVAALHAVGTSSAATARLDLAELARAGCPFGAPTVLVIGAVAGRAGGQPTWPVVGEEGNDRLQEVDCPTYDGWTCGGCFT